MKTKDLLISRRTNRNKTFMKITCILFSYILYAINSLVLSQEHLSNLNEKIGISVGVETTSDSLLKKSFKDLRDSFKKYSNDSVLAKIYVKSYILKAKDENDSLQMANGYLYASQISSAQKEIEYLDSLISISKNMKNPRYPGLGYLIKGVCYYDLEDYELALKNYLIGQKYAIANNNIEHQITIKHNIGLLKKAIGAHKEALKAFKENLDFIKTQDTINKYPRSYITTLFAIADSYHRMELGDSAKYYVDAGLLKSYHNNDKYKYPDFLLLSGINSFLLEKYQKSLDSLLKASDIIQKSNSYNPNEAYCYIQIGKALQNLNQYEKSIYYLKKADSITTLDNYTDEKRIAYELLIEHYKKVGDIHNQLKVMSKLIAFDSIYYAKNKNLKSDIITKYDTALLVGERDDIIKKLEKEKNTSKTGLKISVGILFVLLLFLINYYRKQKIYKNRFDQLIRQSNNNTTKPIKNEKIKEIGLSDEIISDILDKLENFEQNKEFLNPDIKMSTISKKIKTNSSYLSKVVNIYKGKNFTNYINDLRVEYCIEKLKIDKKFRRYSIEYIGKEVGFGSIQSFTRAFTKKTGLTVSYFVKSIESH